jgi:hypothetical protein
MYKKDILERMPYYTGPGSIEKWDQLFSENSRLINKKTPLSTGFAFKNNPNLENFPN